MNETIDSMFWMTLSDFSSSLMIVLS